MLLGSWRRGRRSHVFLDDPRLEFGPKSNDMLGKRHQMQQHVGVHYQKQPRPNHEEDCDRQVRVQERELDRVLEQEVAVRHAAHGDGEVQKDEQITEPHARADARSVDDRGAQGFEALRLGGKLHGGRFGCLSRRRIVAVCDIRHRRDLVHPFRLVRPWQSSIRPADGGASGLVLR